MSGRGDSWTPPIRRASPQQAAARESFAEAVDGPVIPEITSGREASSRRCSIAMASARPGLFASACRSLTNSAYTLLARQLDRWLLTNLGVSEKPDDAGGDIHSGTAGSTGMPASWPGRSPEPAPGDRTGGEAMSWPWRMPGTALGHALPVAWRHQRRLVLAEGRCDNFGLAPGSLPGVRRLPTEKKKTPPGVDRPQGPGAGFHRAAGALIAAYDARWQDTALEPLGAITFSARPHWRCDRGPGQ